MLTSDSLIKLGRYKQKKTLKEIPKEYFEQFYRSHVGKYYDNNPDVRDLMEYIEVVIGFKDIPAVNPAKALESALKTLCPKEFFYTEGDAKYRLNYIRKMKAKYNQKHDIPVRVYKCEKCGYWHLTSKQRIGEEIIPTNQEEEKDVYQPVLMDKWLKLLNKED